ncbi:sensor histidine kinase [Salinibacterium soli]|uniref:histidine kinase n=1 Tax=Antiquaquibacter soli TaxID=3064523 RepID=A0ABT9BPJ1_9MICO|nr:histidine kinase [Protaetiibacter sp. WY-16]MDO7882945.1 histidine kinase [Protaetiibacter sp. WY-16]
MIGRTGLRPLDLVLGAAVLVIGIARIAMTLYFSPVVPFLIALGMAVAVTLHRRAPAVALALVWATAILQVVDGRDIALVQLAAVIVAYGTSRYGSTPTLIASVASIPVGGVAAVLYAAFWGPSIIQDSGLADLLRFLTSGSDIAFYDNPLAGLAVGFVLVAALLGAPWSLGLVLRLRERSRAAERELEVAEEETAQAQQLATVRAEQARLARDVHDVVGHSLAVIVAQADSARALPDDEIAGIRTAMANIADTARRSLRDVRTVLSDDAGRAGTTATDDLASLIAGVRSGGTDVAVEELGMPRPLPPELAVVAYRTLQELLTNALKHGVPADGIGVALDWRDDLAIVVRNTAAPEPGPGGGSGLDGVRDRLAAVGGTLETRSDGEDWVATAHVPVRPEGATA